MKKILFVTENLYCGGVEKCLVELLDNISYEKYKIDLLLWRIKMTYIVQFMVAAFATIAFAILFSAPKKELIYCGFTGAFGWIVYFIMTHMGFGVVMTSAVATFLLTIFARSFAVIRCVPATVYLLSGIFPLVPGAGIFYTAYYLFIDNTVYSSTKAIETFEIAGAIVLGIVFGFAIPQGLLSKLSVFSTKL